MFKFLFLILLSTSLHAQVIRAALDIGSGAMKLVVAEIDEDNNSIEQIFYSEEFSLDLKRDMMKSGKPYFSDEIQQKTEKTLAHLKMHVASFNPSSWAGIATMASRQSTNAPQLFQRINDQQKVPISIITQQEEGRLGFVTAVAVSHLAPESVIAFDSGGASFQISTLSEGEVKVLKGDMGYVPAESLLLTKVREGTFHCNSPNPISYDEIGELVHLIKKQLPPLSDELAAKLKDPLSRVIGIGGETSLFASARIALGKTHIIKAELAETLKTFSDKSDEELQMFKEAKEAVIDLALLYAIMDGLEMDEVYYYPSNGSCEGLLIDKNYW